MFKRTLIIIFPIILILIIGISFFRKNSNKAITDSISIGIQSNLFSTPILIAKYRNFFNDNGLEVDIKHYPSGKLAFKAMLNGEVDFCTSTDIPIMSHCFQRKDFSILTTIGTTQNGAWIVARKDKGINKPSDLDGKKIATQKNSAVHFFMHLFLLSNQLENKVDVSFMKATELVEALNNGTIDAFSMRNPFAQNAKELMGEKIIELFDPSLYTQTMNIVTLNKNVEIKQNTIKAMLKSLIEAEDFIKNEKAQTIKILSDIFKSTEENTQNEIKRFSFSITLSQQLQTGLQDEARWQIEKGLTENKSIPNFLNYIYSDALYNLDQNRVSLFSQIPRKIKIAHGSQPIAALVYIAYHNKYFSKEKIDVELVPFSSGKECLNSLLKYDVHLATVSEIPVLLANIKGNHVKILATIEKSDKNISLYTNKQNGINQIIDLKNKKVGVTRSTGGEYLLSLLLSSNGINLKDVTLVDVEPNLMFNEFVNENVDAVITWNPHSREIQKQSNIPYNRFTGENLYFPTFNIVSLPDLINANDTRFCKLIRALIKAQEFLLGNPEKAKDIVSIFSKMQIEDINEIWPIFDFSVDLKKELLMTMRDQSRWFTEQGITDSIKIDNFRSLFHTSCLQKHAPELVQLD